jgi:DNA-directed RNA polymerase subunit RPC12/RpoP
MVACAYCEHTLICDSCQAEFVPASPQQYEALSMSEDLITCPGCNQVLVCHWCKTPYDGEAEDDEAEGPPTG